MSSETAGVSLPEAQSDKAGLSTWKRLIVWLNTKWQSFIAWRDCVWEIFQDLGEVLSLCRFSVIVVLLAGLALAFTDQGQDLLVITAEESDTAYLMVFVFFWAYSAWYWARVVLTHGATIPTRSSCNKPIFGRRVRRVQWLIRYAPRVIGTTAFVMILLAQGLAIWTLDLRSETEDELWRQLGWIAAEALVFFLVFVVRRPTSKFLYERLARSRIGPLNLLNVDDTLAYRKASLLHLPVNVIVHALIFVGGWFLLLIAAIVDPTAVGGSGAIPTFMLAAATWTAIGTAILFLSRGGNFPVMTALILMAVVFSFFNDNHGVRALKSEARSDAQRQKLKTVFDDWQATQDDPDQPLVLVATAGGGSRAAYWTATVLGALRAGHGDFDRVLFGISGVSGGSLGAVVHRAMVTREMNGSLSCKRSDEFAKAHKDFRDFDACTQSVLGGGFLGPALAGLLYPDLVQRFLPIGFLPDRSEALELAWEESWRSVVGQTDDQSNLLAGDFLDLWANRNGEARFWPALFLNGTSVASGKRIVTSNVDIARDEAGDEPLSDATDFFSDWGLSIRASTAANNSARFPGIGAAGTLVPGKAGAAVGSDRIVDGGYFENFGAATAQDLLQYLKRNKCPDHNERCLFKPIVIQISSDPHYPGVVRRDGLDHYPIVGTADQAPSPGSFGAEVRSPIKALLNTRSSRGVLAAQQLHDWTIDQDGHFIEFRLINEDDRGDPPLGWALSKEARRNMNCQLANNDGANVKQLETLRNILGAETFDPIAALQHSKTVCETKKQG